MVIFLFYINIFKIASNISIFAGVCVWLWSVCVFVLLYVSRSVCLVLYLCVCVCVVLYLSLSFCVCVCVCVCVVYLNSGCGGISPPGLCTPLPTLPLGTTTATTWCPSSLCTGETVCVCVCVRGTV